MNTLTEDKLMQGYHRGLAVLVIKKMKIELSEKNITTIAEFINAYEEITKE